MKKTVFLALLSLLSAATLRADAVTDAIARAAEQAPREALATLEAAAKAAPGRADLLAERSIAWSDCADIEAKKGARKEAATRAMELAQKAVAAGPRLARAHLALAVACGKMTDHVDNSTKMTLSRQIREEALRTVELDPREALAYEILGRWEYGFATLNPLLKAAARMVYGELPPASLENAAGYLEKAVKLNPDAISPNYQLALVYKAMGEKAKALRQWKAVAALPATDAEDEAARKEAARAIGKP